MAQKKQKKRTAGKIITHSEGYYKKTLYVREITGRALVLKLIRPELLKLMRGNKIAEISREDNKRIVLEKYTSEEELKQDYLAGFFGRSLYYHYRALLRGDDNIPTKEKIAERILLDFYRKNYNELAILDEQISKKEQNKGGGIGASKRGSSPEEVLAEAQQEAQSMYEEQKTTGMLPDYYED